MPRQVLRGKARAIDTGGKLILAGYAQLVAVDVRYIQAMLREIFVGSDASKMNHLGGEA